MNTWIIATIVVGLIAIAGIAFVNASTIDNEPSTTTCTTCGKTCTGENNCGLKTCGAVNGGTCGCGR